MNTFCNLCKNKNDCNWQEYLKGNDASNCSYYQPRKSNDSKSQERIFCGEPQGQAAEQET
jgi:hypothetical protein